MTKDLTEGKPNEVLWKFTMPMFVSVVFQQLYNIADSIIAGKFAGENALAAVGASYPITMIFMAIAVGSNIGCSVIISQLFGAKKYGKMKTAISTTMIASVIVSIVLTILGLLSSAWFMLMINTPGNIFEDGALYLRIYIGGFIFLFLYNIATGIFTSLGDSKTPLYFLIGSSIGNVILDLLFVAVFHWGVAGVAWATFMAQGVACIFVIITLVTRIKQIRITEPFQKFSWEMLGKISFIAIPSILQQSFISIGNIFIQSLVNSFGSSVIAGYSAAIKLNTFTITGLMTMGNGISSFSAQNIGAGKKERVNQGFRAGIKLAVIVVVPFFFLYFFFGTTVMSFFLNAGSRQAMNTGVKFLRIVSPFYFVVAVKLISDGVLRGSGAMRQFMISTFTDLILRVVLAYIFASFWAENGIWLSWPFGWTVGTIAAYLFYHSGVWAKTTKIGDYD